MNKHNTILEELSQISSAVANIEHREVYSVPNGYFEGLATCILQQIRAEALLSKATSATYTAPTGYFDQLPSSILNKVKADTISEELMATAPVLAGINRHNVYEVPEGYFETFAVAVTATPTAKVVKMTIVRRWVSYAAAAVVVGVLVTGAVLLMQSSGNNQPTVAEVEIARQINVPQAVNSIPEETITAFLDTHANTADYTDSEPNSSQDELDVNLFIESATDEEILNYLNEHEVMDENIGKGI
jgi:adenylate kinase